MSCLGCQEKLFGLSEKLFQLVYVPCCFSQAAPSSSEDDITHYTEGDISGCRGLVKFGHVMGKGLYWDLNP